VVELLLFPSGNDTNFLIGIKGAPLRIQSCTALRSEESPGYGEVKTRWLNDRPALLALRPDWEALLANSASDTIFLTPEWTAAWLEAYGHEHDLRALAVYRGEVLIGLALLSIRPGPGPALLGVRTLAFATDGSEDSDYLDLISWRGEEETVVKATMTALTAQRRDWSLLRWNEIPEASPHLAPLRRWLAVAGWYVEEAPVPCAYVALPDTWDAYLKMLKPRMRTKVRSLLGRMDARADASFDLCDNPDGLPARLQSLYALHRSRWELRDRVGIFEDPAKRAFYENMSRAFLERGWLRLYGLRIGDAYVAQQFCFERNGVISLLQEGFDKDWAEQGVGNALRAHVFRDAIGRGVSVYDFLAGVTPHKLSWGAAQKTSLRLTAAPPGLHGTTYFTARRTARWGKRQAKTTLRGLGLYRPPS